MFLEIISVFRMGGHSNQDYKMMNLIDRYRLFGTNGYNKDDYEVMHHILFWN